MTHRIRSDADEIVQAPTQRPTSSLAAMMHDATTRPNEPTATIAELHDLESTRLKIAARLREHEARLNDPDVIDAALASQHEPEKRHTIDPSRGATTIDLPNVEAERRANVAREHAAAVRRASSAIVLQEALSQVTRAILAEAARASHHDDPTMLLRRIATEIAGAASHIETGNVDSIDRAIDLLREMGK